MYASKEKEIIDKLQQFRVHLTQNRITVFKLLTKSKTALSVSLIMKQSRLSLDRISVYRTLKYFSEKGIVEIVPNNKGNARYILASSGNRAAKNKNSNTAYFVCSSCQYTELIQGPANIRLDLLTKHHASKYSLIVEGLCASCK